MTQNVTCGKCGSNKVQPLPYALAMFAAGGCLLIIPFIGWVLCPAFTLVALSMWLSGKHYYKCQDCKRVFTVDSEKHKAYKRHNS